MPSGRVMILFLIHRCAFALERATLASGHMCVCLPLRRGVKSVDMMMTMTTMAYTLLSFISSVCSFSFLLRFVVVAAEVGIRRVPGLAVSSRWWVS